MSKVFKNINELLRHAVDCIDERYQFGSNFKGKSIEFMDSDYFSSGARAEEVIVISEHSSRSDISIFTINQAINISIESKVGIGIFSMEMSAKLLIFFMMATIGKIDAKKLYSGQLDKDEWPSLTSAVSKLHNTDIFVDETSVLTFTEIRDRTLQLKNKHNIKMLVLDSLQHIKFESKLETNESILKDFKSLAKEINISINIIFKSY